MTQPIDVAYVDIVSNSRDFRKELSKEMDIAVKDIEKQSKSVSEKVEKTFKDAGDGARGAFTDSEGRLTGIFDTVEGAAKESAKALGNVGQAAGEAASGGLRQLLSTFGNITGIVGQLAASGPVGIAALVAGFVVLAGAISAAAAVLQAFLTIAAAGLAALPGLVLAAVAGFGILAVALNGVVDAFGEQAEGAKKAGGAAVNNARQIADAQRGILQAQKELVKAREDELKRIRDIQIALNRAHVTEARALDDVKNAQLELADARKLNSPRAETEAQLRLDEANATLLEAQARTKDLAAEKKKADKVGVEGSDQVLAAQERLIDAQDRLAASQQKMGGGAAAQATAFSKLSTSAQLFVTALVKAKDALAPVAKGIQEAFFAGSAPLIQPIVDNIKELQPELNRVAAGFGKIFQEFLKFLGSPEAKTALDSILTGLAEFLEAVGPSIGPLLKAFADLAGQAGEFGGELGGVVADALMNIADFVKNVDLKQLFDDAKKALKDILPIIKPLLSITKDLFVILVEFGKVALPPLAFTLTVVAGAFKLLAIAVSGFFEFAKPAFDWLAVNGPKAIKAIVDAIIGLPGKITSAGAAMLEAGKKFIGKFFEGVGAAGGFIADFSKKLTNAFIGAINSQVIGPINNGIRRIQDGLNMIPLFGNVKLSTIPNIPKLAKGGLGVKNSLVEISEDNREEAVIPLENQRVLNKVGTAIAQAGGATGSGGDDVTVMVFVGNEPIAAQATKVVRTANKKTARSVKQKPRMI
jgi:hypothetical protein